MWALRVCKNEQTAAKHPNGTAIPERANDIIIQESTVFIPQVNLNTETKFKFVIS